MRWLACVLLLFGLAACDAARPNFYGVEKREIAIEGSRFSLRFQGDLVEATRTSPEWLPRFEDVARKAGIAAQIESGCRAVWVEGDPAMMWIGLSCDGKAAPKKRKRPKTIYCEFEPLSKDGTSSGGQLYCQKDGR